MTFENGSLDQVIYGIHFEYIVVTRFGHIIHFACALILRMWRIARIFSPVSACSLVNFVCWRLSLRFWHINPLFIKPNRNSHSFWSVIFGVNCVLSVLMTSGGTGHWLACRKVDPHSSSSVNGLQLEEIFSPMTSAWSFLICTIKSTLTHGKQHRKS